MCVFVIKPACDHSLRTSRLLVLRHPRRNLIDLGGLDVFAAGVGLTVRHDEVVAMDAVGHDVDWDFGCALQWASRAEFGRYTGGTPGIILAVGVDQACGVDVVPSCSVRVDLGLGRASRDAVRLTLGSWWEKQCALPGPVLLVDES